MLIFAINKGGEKYAGLVKEGQRVALKLDAYPDRTFEGKVAKIIREVDRSRKLITVTVFADLPKETPFGATVDGQIEVENKKGASNSCKRIQGWLCACI